MAANMANTSSVLNGFLWLRGHFDRIVIIPILCPICVLGLITVRHGNVFSSLSLVKSVVICVAYIAG